MNPPRSHGIFQAFEQGAVTSATLVVNGSDSDSAARNAKHRKLPTGLHLNLTEGEPLSPAKSISTLVEAHGGFFDRHTLRRLLDEGRVDLQHVEREVRAQIEWFLEHHGGPTHLDGHHHIHIHPVVAGVLPDILIRYGILAVRIPCETLPPFGYEVSDDQLAHVRAINDAATNARAHYVANGITSTDHFRGLTLVGRASAKNLRHVLGRLPEGTTELMVHPGSMTPIGTPFDIDPQRQTELAMLTDPALQGFLAEKKVQLCSFGDLSA